MKQLVHEEKLARPACDENIHCFVLGEEGDTEM